MNTEPRREGDYSGRQVQAAHRVLVDIGQVLAEFHDSIVVRLYALRAAKQEFGSPSWTHFELLRHKIQSARANTTHFQSIR